MTRERNPEPKFVLEERRTCAGPPGAVLAHARERLEGLAFRIEHEGPRRLRARGLRMQSSRQPGLTFSRWIEVEVVGPAVGVRGDNGALRDLLAIVLIAPGGIALVVLAILLPILYFKGLPIPWLPAVLPALGIPLLISGIQAPIFIRVFGRRSREAVAAFADELARVGSQGEDEATRIGGEVAELPVAGELAAGLPRAAGRGDA